MKKRLMVLVLAATTCLGSSMLVSADVTGAELYSLYGGVLKEKINTYGEVVLNETDDRLDGVCFVKLVDFNNDGNDEMLMVYENNDASAYKGSYVYEIWAGVGDDVQMMDTGTLFATNGGCQTLYLTKYNDQYYVVSGSGGENTAYEYHGYTQGSYGVVHQAASEINNSTGQFDYTVDGAEVSQDSWLADQNSWQAECEQYKMNYSPSTEEMQNTFDTITQIESGQVK